MRKGTKRKTKHSEEEPKPNDAAPAPSKPTKAPSRAKRVKPESEPEYFEDKRNLEDLWRETFPVGTEWDQLDSFYQFKWDFSNLELNLSRSKGKAKLAAYLLSWLDSQVDRLKSQIFILSCTQRRSALKHLKEDRLKKYEYCLPYFYQPFKEDEIEQSTEVQIEQSTVVKGCEKVLFTTVAASNRCEKYKKTFKKKYFSQRLGQNHCERLSKSTFHIGCSLQPM